MFGKDKNAVHTDGVVQHLIVIFSSAIFVKIFEKMIPKDTFQNYTHSTTLDCGV